MTLRDRRGFTLIELLLILFLIGLMTGLLGLSQGRFVSGFRLSSGARQIMTDLRLVRAKALSQRTSFRVTFPAGGRSYFVERFDDEAALPDYEHYALYGRGDGARVGGSTPVSIALPTGVHLLDARTVTFRPRGTSNGSPAVRVGHDVLTTTQTVRVSLNGLVTVEP